MTLEDAGQMPPAAQAKVASLGIAYDIAVIDPGEHLVTFHTIKTIAFEQINEYLALLRTGEIVGRAVMKV